MKCVAEHKNYSPNTDKALPERAQEVPAAPVMAESITTSTWRTIFQSNFLLSLDMDLSIRTIEARMNTK